MRMIRRMAVWAAAGGLMLAMGGAGRGEQGSGVNAGSQAGQTVLQGVVPVAPRDVRTVSMEEEQAKLRNIDRQKKLVEDTAKLLELANEAEGGGGQVGQEHAVAGCGAQGG